MLKRNEHHRAWLLLLVTSSIIFGILARPVRARGQAVNDTQDAADTPQDTAVTGLEPSGAATDEGPAPRSDAARRDSASGTTFAISSDGVDSKNATDVSTAVGSSKGSSGTDQVLELPQLVNLGNGSSSDQSAENGPSNDGQASPEGDPPGLAAADNLPAGPEQLGTLQDYENQASQMPPGVVLLAPGMAFVPLASSLPLNLPFRPLSPPGVVTSPIIVAPTSGGPLPSTSPMLMAPRIRTFGFAPRGGFMAFRR
jgi:hypothetical protein